MGNAFTSEATKTKKRELSETRIDDLDEDDTLSSLPYDVRCIASGEVELSEEQCEAAGMYLYEMVQANLDYDLNPVLARGGVDRVVAIEPLSELSFTVPQLDTLHAICFWEWAANPPDNATIRMMGPVRRRALWRFWSGEWKYHGGSTYNGANCRGKAMSLRAFPSFKATAIEMSGGNVNEAFWLKQLRVRARDWRSDVTVMSPATRMWHLRLSYIVGQTRAIPHWAEANKQWLIDTGLFSAWEKHCESLGGPPRSGGWTGEIRGRDSQIMAAHNRRLQGKDFVYPDSGKLCCVLVVRWSEKWEQFVALCYEADLAIPNVNLTSTYYIHRMVPLCWPACVDDVTEWIERTPKRARLAE